MTADPTPIPNHAVAGRCRRPHCVRRRRLRRRGLLETTSVRLFKSPSSASAAPQYVAEELLRAEGFNEIRLCGSAAPDVPQAVARWRGGFQSGASRAIRSGDDRGRRPITILGRCACRLLRIVRANEGIRSIADLKGKSVGLQALGSPARLLKLMAAHVGLDPEKDIRGSPIPRSNRSSCSQQGKIDAFLGLPAGAPRTAGPPCRPCHCEYRRGSPVVAVFLLHAGRQPGVRSETPGRDKARPARDLKGRRSLRHRADAGRATARRSAAFTAKYDYALQTLSELPYDKWRDYDAEDTVRFYALRLHEAGFDQIEPAEDHCRQYRLAFLRRAQTRVEGVSAIKGVFACR